MTSHTSIFWCSQLPEPQFVFQGSRSRDLLSTTSVTRGQQNHTLTDNFRGWCWSIPIPSASGHFKINSWAAGRNRVSVTLIMLPLNRGISPMTGESKGYLLRGLNINQSIYQSIYLPIYLTIYLSIYPHTCTHARTCIYKYMCTGNPLNSSELFGCCLNNMGKKLNGPNCNIPSVWSTVFAVRKWRNSSG